MLLAVVHSYGQAHEIGQHGGAARPGLDRALVVCAANRLHLLDQGQVDERALLDLTCHALGPHFFCRNWTIIPRVRLLLRVLYPLAGTPKGLTGSRPADVLPSPPPCGWSIGFIATPRTVGRTPRQRIAPALPIERRLCSSLPTSPMVARQSTCTFRISPQRSLSCA